MDNLIKELDEKNLLHLNSSKIKQNKNDILQKLYLTRTELIKHHKILKDYRHVDELDEIKIGSYIRWFNIQNPENMKLTNGGLIIDIKKGNDDINIVCKNFRNRIFTLCLNKCIIFQKINNQEKILIKIIDHIYK